MPEWEPGEGSSLDQRRALAEQDVWVTRPELRERRAFGELKRGAPLGGQEE